ncbi:MAG TPA: hypothetical protein IGS17_03460 [Oscillatoriales cyanobacterium M59_W2019_021]|nr:MAG: hypothetical protein D6728_10875 [Cyanobacteria bacterium J055]HIK29986.1 hypothetical protein [Oscillatoriales cyanobacterium M4454_W2019_049]HIK49971.1 hypothetical protein [Oscillatoriales cyanobacterium M59_W2019_021]
MLDNQKAQELECLVLGGFCPNCRSADIRYREYEENKKFCFQCSQCGWKGKYTSEELTQASQSWHMIQSPDETFES